MLGTIRTLDADMKTLVHKRLRAIVPGIAEANNAEVALEIGEGYPITYNDLYNQMLPTLQRVTGVGSVNIIPAITGGRRFLFLPKKSAWCLLFHRRMSNRLGSVAGSTSSYA